GGRALARHRPARDRARRPGGGRAAPGARLSVAGATRRGRAPHRRLRGRRHPLARVDANARGCARPTGDVVARAGDHQSRRRAAGVARAGRAPRPRHRPRAPRRDLRTRSRAPRALPRGARSAARAGRKGMIFFMDATAELRIAEDPSALAEIAAQEVLAVARAAVAAHGRFTVALAGGSTPRATYTRLAQPPLAAQMPWDRTVVFFGDERGVPPDPPGSPVLKETFRTVAAVHAAAATIPQRFTLTYPILNAAACVIYLVSGAEKAKVVKAALGDRSSGLPAAMVRPTAGRLLWILDRAAAALLPSRRTS